MATTTAPADHSAELARAGAGVSGKWGAFKFFCRRYPLGAVGAGITLLFMLTAIFAGVITQYDPTSTNAKVSLARPGVTYFDKKGVAVKDPEKSRDQVVSSQRHILGADFMGRDMFSRIVYGARISLIVAFFSTTIGCMIGMTIGLLSGYFGGWFDLITQRFMDMMQSLPLLVMALIMAASLGPSLPNTIIAIAIPLVPNVARVIRSNTLALREMPYVEAARAVGMSEVAIAFRHVLPNTLAPLIVLGTAQFGSAILVEASLSFLGLGVPEPHPSWGRMLSESAAEYMRTAPWLVIFPGIAISLAVFGTNLLGDALRDLLDPRQRT